MKRIWWSIRDRVSYLLGRARYELLALKWRWLTRNMVKSPITLAHSRDSRFMLPGDMLHDGEREIRVARIDRRDGVLWVVSP